MLVADVFIYLDDVQYTKKDWRNTNQLKSPNGIKKVSVPVSNASRSININEALISYKGDWEDKMLNQLKQWYGKALFYNNVIEMISPIIRNKYKNLVDLNYDLNKTIADYLDISTPCYFSSSICKSTEDKNLRILEICHHFKNVHLLYDGKTAANFLDTQLFLQNGIKVIFQNYLHTPYRQLWGEFQPYMSIVDLIMNNDCLKSQEILSSSPVTEEF
jgi:hypothetical protein